MDTPPHGRRQFRRVPFRAQVTVNLSPHLASVEANVLDISLGGIRLLSSEPISKDMGIVLAFQFRNHLDAKSERISGHVIHVRMDDDAWEVGVQFDHALDPQSTPLLTQAVARKTTQS
jgi:c-di-GMP-binding flagellar brake protein YcgR